MSNNDKRIPDFEVPSVNIGFGNLLAAHRIIAVVECGSSPSKRLREQAAKAQRLIDASKGRKMRSLIVTDSNHVVISGLGPQTIQERLAGSRRSKSTAQLELQDGEFIS